jgi:hypothetical protein
MELAGHTSLNTTLRYMHVVGDGAATAIAALEAFDQKGSASERQDGGRVGGKFKFEELGGSG